ncbi:endonuclease [uncultured Polaribacter sp.]|uniref:fibronectin type III domain-containing protein n=1 Tax=uncultured Polaribacter sp. TaxID=174711 RepID=UPI00262E7179|nr:endonuclease [uncultured Polaribacter sp.]
MKKLLLFCALIISCSAFSQIPNYYNDVNLNQTSTALKDALAIKIITTHTTNLSYTPGVWDALKQTDLDPNDNTKVLLIYGYSDIDGNYVTDRTRDKNLNGGTSGTQWNREHTYPKSLGTPNLGTSGPGADVHHLRAADITFNGQRSSKKFADGSGNAGDVSGGWYPGDEWKGDVARMMMYTYLRYGDQCLPTGVAIGSTATSDVNMLNLFLEWNTEDPVSNFEKQRNPILEGIQGNRNPFIDNPAFATQIWGGPQAEDLFGNPPNGDTESPTAPTNLIASNATQSSVDLTWTASTDNTAVTGYAIFNGTTQVSTTLNTNFTVSNLMAGTSYSFYVKAFDAAANVSSISNAVSITTTSNETGSGTATELLISEYIEGSSNNKAIEIANFTGVTVDLAAYSIKKATNGGGTFSSTLTLTGNLANGQVYVIAHSSATATILNVANLTNNGVMSFNGNDAMGLFKNDVLIDLIGDASNSSNFAQNVTLQRKSSVTSPNNSYSATEWNSFSTDTFNGLGNHSIDGGTTSDTEAPSSPANLVASNILQNMVDLNWSAATDDTAVTGYDVYQNGVKITTVTNTTYTVSGLADNTAYSFSITAFDAAANVSSASNTVFITTLPVPDTTAPTAPTNLTSSNITQTTADLSWAASTDNVAVTGYDIYQNSTIIASISGTNYTVSELTSGTSYNFLVTAKDDAGNISNASNILNVTTESAPINGTTTELLISEYVEGSSNNKAIEIANFTGNAVDLSSYSLRKATNGSGSFSSVLNLDGNLANEQVYVIANTNANAIILNVANITNETVLSFNGNDAIGLFKNGILIDLIGDELSSSVFAQDVTLQRKSSITSPNVTYIISEWNSLATDIFSGLGNHFIDGGVIPDTSAPSIPSNLVTSNITETSVYLSWSASTDDTAVTGYDIYNGTNIIGSAVSTNFNVTGLSAVTSYNFTITAKDEAGNVSSSSDSVNVNTIDLTAPSAPVNLSVLNITQTTLDLTWSSSTDNVGVISYDILNGNSFIGSISINNFSISGLTENTTYSFSVVAKDAAGNSTTSNPVTVTTLAQPTNTSTILSESYFESGWDNWIDGGSDAYRYAGSRSFEGTYSIRIRDNSGSVSAMTSQIYDLSSFDTVEVEFHFYSYSMENNEDFWLRYYNGNSWTTVATYARGTDFENNNFYSATVTLNKNENVFANNAQLRFQNDASGNADHIYIDQVIVTGKTGSFSAKSSVKHSKSTTFLKSLNTDEFNNFEADFKIYPNPTTGSFVHIKLQNTDSENITFKISNTLGQVVKKGTLLKNTIDVKSLRKGIYVIEINDGEEKMTKKLIKK